MGGGKDEESDSDESILELESDSDESILELEKPSKPPPVVIQLEEDLIINVSSQEQQEPVTDGETLATAKSPTPAGQMTMTGQIDDMNPYHWTKDMIQFYNEDGDDNDFDEVRSQMDDNPRLWRTDFHFQPKGRRKRCFNCGQLGHDEKRCRPICCVYCGADDHFVRTCPRKICLSCGKRCFGFITACDNCNKKRSQSCQRCGVYGHVYVDCPDHWRRFHHVTTLETVVPPDKPVNKDPSQFWCCNCAKKGHLEVDCPDPKPRDFAPSSTLVHSYDRGFAFDKADLGGRSDPADQVVQLPSSSGGFRPSGKNKRYYEMAQDAPSLKRKGDELVGSPRKMARKSYGVGTDSAPEYIPLDNFVDEYDEFQHPIPTNNPGIFIINEKVNQAANKRIVDWTPSVANLTPSPRQKKRKPKHKNSPVVAQPNATTNSLVLNMAKESSIPAPPKAKKNSMGLNLESSMRASPGAPSTSGYKARKRRRDKLWKKEKKKQMMSMEAMNARVIDVGTPKNPKTDYRRRKVPIGEKNKRVENINSPKGASSAAAGRERWSSRPRAETPGKSREVGKPGPSRALSGEPNTQVRPQNRKIYYERNLPSRHSTEFFNGPPMQRGPQPQGRYFRLNHVYKPSRSQRVEDWNDFLLGFKK